ncbi:hypothetical protein AS888_05435 [Peribacillus simplex]|uniref:Knr4/Smi1-like domain-containing protein n=1 Tax=Peribacillus simplex TaxID=1478 RepID=A0A109N1U0_9BACI|nr:SMI1/KNR4 family protein [Peribacillus simplex]KWW21926.1 hypothetical protein AS888_05435 [Peribacillus simplex]
MHNVTEILLGLKNRLDSSNRLLIQATHGNVHWTRFTFNPPIPVKELDRLVNKENLILPEGYKEFLLLHNGVYLFEDEYSAGIALYKAQDIPNRLKQFQYNFGPYLTEDNRGSYPIGSYPNIGEIMINYNYIKEGRKDYMWIADDQMSKMGQNTFESWLDKLIVSQGSFFWEWN